MNKYPRNGCRTVLKVLTIFGLSFDEIQRPTKYVFLQFLLVLYMHGILSLYLARILQFLLYKGKFMKSASSLLISLSISLFLWIHTFWKRKDIASLVEATYKLGLNHRKPHWATKYIFPTLAICSFLTPLVTFLIFFNRKDRHSFHVFITFGPSVASVLDKFGLTSLVFYTYSCSVHCFLDLMQNLLTLLCSWMFLQVRHTLERCEDMLLYSNPPERLYHRVALPPVPFRVQVQIFHGIGNGPNRASAKCVRFPDHIHVPQWYSGWKRWWIYVERNDSEFPFSHGRKDGLFDMPAFQCGGC